MFWYLPFGVSTNQMRMAYVYYTVSLRVSNQPPYFGSFHWIEVYYVHEVCHSCTINLVHGIVPEVYYLHEVCHSCTNLVHGIVPEVYYLHEVCHSCTNLVHGTVPEVYYLHEVCHSCTNLVHGIVPEVYYLHEVCHSCTNLVHGTVPEVYYLHEVCHSCTNLVHGVVLQEQWILAISWRIVPQTDTQGFKKQQCSLGELPGVRVRELYLSRAPLHVACLPHTKVWLRQV